MLTPVLNAASTLEETILSVLQQDYTSWEHWILDGGSTDSTTHILAKYPHLKIRTSPDRNLYDALNTGASLASGQWLIFLQGDDWLPQGALKAWANSAKANPQAQIITGSTEFIRHPAPNSPPSTQSLVKSITSPSAKQLNVKTIALGEPMLNARAIRREFFLQLGGFNIHWRLASDREFLIRASLLTPPTATIPNLVYRYRWHSNSQTLTDFSKLSPILREENLEIAEHHIHSTSKTYHLPLRLWHTQEAVHAFLTELESLNFKSALQFALRGLKYNPLWPLFLIAESLRCLPGFIARGFKTRSQLAKNSPNPNESPLIE
ncbi:MAG: glycosyltransferase [Chthoniobacterales bacterium]|nr:glycosyltransferase [Chthoniobacterales bacterium]